MDNNFRILRQSRVANAVLQITKGDLTLQDTDAIVNAANERLAHGGGLAAAIVRRGGQEQQKVSDEWVRKNGDVACGGGVAVTPSTGDLRSKVVIHVVGPRYKDGHHGEAELLRGAIHAALYEADQKLRLKTIAIPAISSGIFGYPLAECTEILVQTVIEYLEAENENLELVRIMDFSDSVLGGILEAFDETL